MRIDDVAYPSAEQRCRWETEAWLGETVGDVVAAAAAEVGEKTAIADAGGRLSYRELDRRSAAAARHLLAGGLRPGDRVLLQVGTGRAATLALVALFRAGLVPVCAVAQYRAYEMGALAALSEARAHLIEPAAAPNADLLALSEQLRAEHRGLAATIVAGQAPAPGTIPLEPEGGAAAPAVELPRVGPLDVATFQLSGGTTGVPKIIPRFHAEYLGYAAAWADRLAIGADDVLLWSLPIAHNAGMLCFLLPSLLRRATLYLQGRFDAVEFLTTIGRERVTVTGSIGPIAPRLLDVEHPERYDLGSLRLFVTLNRASDIERHLGRPAMNIYGITEGLLLASAVDAPVAARHGTVGRPASPWDEVKVLALGEEREVELGELCFRGPSTTPGYFRDPDATAAAFTSDGFFRSGDVVRAHVIEGETHLSFEGRAKDNIDRGGEKFGTEEIEALLAGHPAIQEARVVGMPDPYLGERVCAFVCLQPGAEPPGIEELGGFLLARGLAKFKLPERIEPIAEMPVTSVGKLDRGALRARIAATLAEEGGS